MAYPLVNQDVSIVNEQLAEVESEMQVDEQNGLVENSADLVKDAELTELETVTDQAAIVEQIPNAATRLATAARKDEPNIDLTSFLDDSESIAESHFASPSTTFFSSGSVSTGLDHPDGIFGEVIPNDARSISAAEMPDVLDLLTATF